MLLSFKLSWNTLDNSPLSDVSFANTLSLSVACLLILLILYFRVAAFNVNEVPFSNYLFHVPYLWCCIEINFFNTRVTGFLLCYLLRFTVLCCPFRSVICFELMLVKGVIYVLGFFFFCIWMSSCASHFVEKIIFDYLFLPLPKSPKFLSVFHHENLMGFCN